MLQLPLHLWHYSNGFVAQPQNSKADQGTQLAKLSTWLPPNAKPDEIARGIGMNDAQYTQMLAQQLAEYADQRDSECADVKAVADRRRAQLQHSTALDRHIVALQKRSGQVLCVSHTCCQLTPQLAMYFF